MTKAILINETYETTNKLNREDKKLLIVIIGDKRYAEYYNGAYYISLEEKEKIGERLIGNTTALVENYVYRIYRINPETNKFEHGGYI